MQTKINQMSYAEGLKLIATTMLEHTPVGYTKEQKDLFQEGFATAIWLITSGEFGKKPPEQINLFQFPNFDKEKEVK